LVRARARARARSRACAALTPPPPAVAFKFMLCAFQAPCLLHAQRVKVADKYGVRGDKVSVCDMTFGFPLYVAQELAHVRAVGARTTGAAKQ